jgi:hypothetical protein
MDNFLNLIIKQFHLFNNRQKTREVYRINSIKKILILIGVKVNIKTNNILLILSGFCAGFVLNFKKFQIVLEPI